MTQREEQRFVQSPNDQRTQTRRYGRRRLFSAEAALRRRATHWCAPNRWQFIAPNYHGIP